MIPNLPIPEVGKIILNKPAYYQKYHFTGVSPSPIVVSPEGPPPEAPQPPEYTPPFGQPEGPTQED